MNTAEPKKNLAKYIGIYLQHINEPLPAGGNAVVGALKTAQVKKERYSDDKKRQSLSKANNGDAKKAR